MQFELAEVEWHLARLESKTLNRARARLDSNQGPRNYEFPALTAELRARAAERTAARRRATGADPLHSPPMKVFQAEREFTTTGGLHVTDITEDVAEIVRESGVQDGICLVYSPHTTCCVRVNEYERGMFEDFGTLLRRLVPHETYYAHDDWDRRTENICEEDMEQPNGHAHCMSMILGSAGESIPVGEGELVPRNLAARSLHRARPLAAPPLALQGRRLVGR